MKRVMGSCLLAALVAGSVFAQQLSTTPAPRDKGWVARVERDAAKAKQGGWELVFIGDSITDFWQNRGTAEWDKYFGCAALRRQHHFVHRECGLRLDIRPAAEPGLV